MPQKVIGNLGDVQKAGERQAVQGLHVLEPLGKTKAGAADPAVDQRVEDKGIVGTGGKAQGKDPAFALRLAAM